MRKKHVDTNSHNIKVSIGTAKQFFDLSKIKNLDDLKKEYRRLSLKLHPDREGGSQETFVLMNDEYNNLMNSWMKQQNFTAAEIKNEVEIDEIYKQLVISLMEFEDIKIEIIGSWIWVSGNTYFIKDILKANKFMFAPQKKMWYMNVLGTKTKKGSEMDIDKIRNKYGTIEFKPTGKAKLNGVKTTKLKKQFSKLIAAVKKRTKYSKKLSGVIKFKPVN